MKTASARESRRTDDASVATPAIDDTKAEVRPEGMLGRCDVVCMLYDSRPLNSPATHSVPPPTKKARYLELCVRVCFRLWAKA